MPELISSMPGSPVILFQSDIKCSNVPVTGYKVTLPGW